MKRTLPLIGLLLAPLAARSADEIRDALRAHDRAVDVLDTWIRDPYITLAPDGWYYLTGTTHDNGKDNTGSILLWRSQDLAHWEPRPALWALSDSKWLKDTDRKNSNANKPLMIWAPELHFIDGRWVIVHTTNQRKSNLLLGGAELKAPFTEPMGADFGHRHDPSLLADQGTNWLVYACTQIIPLKPDFSGYEGPGIALKPANRKLGHQGCTILKIGPKYVLFGTAWSTDSMRKGTYNLYYCTADRITGPYSERKFVGRFLGHGTPFQDKAGQWWCTAFFNANAPPLTREQARGKDLSTNAQTINRQGVTIVPLDVKVRDDGSIFIRATDPDYAQPGPDEAQQFVR